MRAIVLAAGQGRRMDADAPSKVLVPVNDRPLIAHTVDALADQDLDVTVVTGAGAEAVRGALGSWVDYVHVPDYDQVNNIVSLWRVRDHTRDGFLLVNDDVLAEPHVFSAILEGSEDCLLVDNSIDLTEEAMRVRIEDGHVERISKEIPLRFSHGEYIGVARFGWLGTHLLFVEIARLIADGGTDQWYEAAIQRLADRMPVRAHTDWKGEWAELDTPEDYEDALERVAPRLRL